MKHLVKKDLTTILKSNHRISGNKTNKNENRVSDTHTQTQIHKTHTKKKKIKNYKT